MEFLNRLKSGEYGLAKTYWLFNALPNLVLGLILETIES